MSDTHTIAINDLVLELLPILAKSYRAEMTEILVASKHKLDELGGGIMSATPNTRAAAYRAKIKMLETALGTAAND